MICGKRIHNEYGRCREELIRMILEKGTSRKTKRWQSTDRIANALTTQELFNCSFSYQVPETLDELRDDVRPFLPWADDHFTTERVSGEPINPGETYKRWRYPTSAENHKVQEFSHSYAERYWPQYANKSPGDKPHRGIRFDYGSLADIVQILLEDPDTRQAYLPIFFPEDLTAARLKERIPCTLGYHFILSSGSSGNEHGLVLNVMYPMRSCDLVRHLDDDVYLTARLLLWVREQILERAQLLEDEEKVRFWQEVKPGQLVMNISSLHCFTGDLAMLSEELKLREGEKAG